MMSTLLDLPPEIIYQIIDYLALDNKPPFIQETSKRPRLASGRPVVCPCSADDNMVVQVLTIAGQDRGRAGKDVISFGLAHPYFKDCIDRVGVCEVVDAVVTEYGALPSSTACIPDIVR
jgi:hypothetical protein